MNFVSEKSINTDQKKKTPKMKKLTLSRSKPNGT